MTNLPIRHNFILLFTPFISRVDTGNKKALGKVKQKYGPSAFFVYW